MLLQLLDGREAGVSAALKAEEDFESGSGLVSEDVELEGLRAVEPLDAVRTLKPLQRISFSFKTGFERFYIVLFGSALFHCFDVFVGRI